MADRAVLLRRLRRLMDDTGYGYSQSSPQFSTNLVSLGLVDKSIAVYIDDSIVAEDVLLPNDTILDSGTAIALSLQLGIRALNTLYSHTTVTFSPTEGYILRSPTMGSSSQIRVVPSSTGSDVTANLKLGVHVGGFESSPILAFSDEELGDILDESLATQADYSLASWTYDSVPVTYESSVIYRTWSTVVDAMMGRAAHYFPQKVGSEESDPSKVFKNLFTLSKWIRGRLDEMLEDLEGGLIEHTSTIWNAEYGIRVGTGAYSEKKHIPSIAQITLGTVSTEAILEYAEILTANPKKMYVAYHEGDVSPFDQTLLNVDSYDVATSKALRETAVLDRELKRLHYPLIKISGLLVSTQYTFQLQVVDQNGERYFSEPLTYITPA